MTSPAMLDLLAVVAMALAGGLGAASRFAVDGAVAARATGSVPCGTALINVTGSFLLGLVTGGLAAAGADPRWTLVVGTGFLGGYTTFSTAMVDSARLLRGGRPGAGIGLLAGTWVAAGAAALLGLLAGVALA